MKLSWTALCSYRFVTSKHINLLELESLISLLRRIRREGIRTRRILVFVDSRVVLGAVSKGRSRSRKVNFIFRKLGFWCLAFVIALELVWVPTWPNPADAPSRSKTIGSWYAALTRLPPLPGATLASTQARSELDLLREPVSATVPPARPAFVENVLPQACVSTSSISSAMQAPRPNAKSSWKEEKLFHTPCWSDNEPSELVQCASWAHPANGIATRLLAERTVVSCRYHAGKNDYLPVFCFEGLITEFVEITHRFPSLRASFSSQVKNV